MQIEIIQPPDWASPKGYANGVVVQGHTRLLFAAGQVAWDADKNIVGPEDFVRQFTQALENVLAVVQEAGGEPEHIVRMTMFITDRKAYWAHQNELGEAYRSLMGRHFPAMSMVQVAALIEDGAMIEIEATAAMP